jgi:VWFA-related protein
VEEDVMRRAMAAAAMAGIVVSQVSAPAAAVGQQTQTTQHTAAGIATPPDTSKAQRLIVMFFDLSSMQKEDVTRAVDSAKDYIDKHMAPTDKLAVVSLVAGLSMEQDFTSDKAALLKAVSRYDGPADGRQVNNGSSFTSDDSEFDALKTNRQLFAIRTICKSIETVDQKKSLLYFSGGLTRQGTGDQSSLRAVTDECVKANTALYAVDTHGLQMLNPVSR